MNLKRTKWCKRVSSLFYLQGIDTFSAPKVELEQYPTGPEIASRMLFTVRGTLWTGPDAREVLGGQCYSIHCPVFLTHK